MSRMDDLVRAPARLDARQRAIDQRGRALRDLRISVTDHCNLRCRYCMPEEIYGPGYRFLPRAELLSFDEIVRLARCLVAMGVDKIRITGGEPLLRRDLDTLVAGLVATGVEDIALTTNGLLLSSEMATRLKAAGLGRITVSLDALEPEVFRRITGSRADPGRVLEAIEAADAAGFGPIKINVVVQRGVNEDAILPLARRFRGSGRILRFIEYMDVGTSNGWSPRDVVSAAEIRAILESEWPLERLQPRYPGEVARRYRYRDGGGEVGFIASVTQPFCGGCSRLRLTADGQFYTCLFSSRGHDLRAPLRDGATDRELRERLARIWAGRGDRYSELRNGAAVASARREMWQMGG